MIKLNLAEEPCCVVCGKTQVSLLSVAAHWLPWWLHLPGPWSYLVTQKSCREDYEVRLVTEGARQVSEAERSLCPGNRMHSWG